MSMSKFKDKRKAICKPQLVVKRKLKTVRSPNLQLCIDTVAIYNEYPVYCGISVHAINRYFQAAAAVFYSFASRSVVVSLNISSKRFDDVC